MKQNILKTGLTMLVLAGMLMLGGCPSPGRDAYQKGLRFYDQGSYIQALEQFDKALEREPDSLMIVYGRALTLYKMENYTEAITALETFLEKSESDRQHFKDERTDAAFYRDKCKEALGLEVERDENAIPPPPMGE